MRCSCRKPRSARTRLENSSTSSEPVIPRSSAWSSWARLTASSWWWIKVSRKVSRSSLAISRNWVRVPPYSRNQRLVSPARETFSTARQRSAQVLNWGGAHHRQDQREGLQRVETGLWNALRGGEIPLPLSAV